MAEQKLNVSATIGLGWIFLGAMFIAFWGEPDIVDAVVYDLTGERVWQERNSEP